MFEQAIFEHIKDNFQISGFTLAFGFKTVPETTKAPYIIQYPLDTSGDSQFLCTDNDFTNGTAFIQWNISHPNAKTAFYLKHELIKFIGELKSIDLNTDTYIIMQNTAASSPSGYDEVQKLHIETVTREFTYYIGD